MCDSQTLGFRFLGACDDPGHEIRCAAKKAKNAAANRRWRAAHSTGRKQGRPALQLLPEQKQARTNAQAAKRMMRLRALRKNARCDIKDIDSITDFSVTQPSLTPWELLGMKRATYFRHKKAGTLQVPAPWNSLDIDVGMVCWLRRRMLDYLHERVSP